MQNQSLAHDYIVRCSKRLMAIGVLFQEASWPDVVRESQEVVELALKALLRHCNIEFPRVHDVSAILEEEARHLPEAIQKNIPKLVSISKSLRRDRELAFYGSEDLTPSEFYKKEDAQTAQEQAEFVVRCVAGIVRR